MSKLSDEDILKVQELLNSAPPPAEVTGVVNGKYFRAKHTRNGEYEVSDLVTTDFADSESVTNPPNQALKQGKAEE